MRVGDGENFSVAPADIDPVPAHPATRKRSADRLRRETGLDVPSSRPDAPIDHPPRPT